MGEHNFDLGSGTIYIEGEPYEVKEGTSVHIEGDESKGVPDYDCENAEELIHDYAKSRMRYDEDEFSLTCKISMIVLLKLVGLWQFIHDNCPNKRVKHLMEHGKNNRIKLKNYYHACNDIARLMRKGHALN